MLNVDHNSVYLMALVIVLLLVLMALHTIAFGGSLIPVVWMIGSAFAVGAFCWVYAHARLD